MTYITPPLWIQNEWMQNQGWVCPKCGRVYSPSCTSCEECNRSAVGTEDQRYRMADSCNCGTSVPCKIHGSSITWTVGAVVLLLLFVTPCFAADIATVARILDGDTVLMEDGRVVRLAGIDAPEAGQCCSNTCKTMLKLFLLERQVELRDLQSPSFGRYEAVFVWQGIDMNAVMVRQGFAWVAPGGNPAWRPYQEEAKRQRIGIWSKPTAIPPWEYRQQKTAPVIRTQPAPIPYQGSFRVSQPVCLT